MLHELGDNLIPIAAMAFGFVVATTWIVMFSISRMFRGWMAMRMKCKLIDRGATADEIVRIVEAGEGDHEWELPSFRARPPVKMSSRFPAEAR